METNCKRISLLAGMAAVAWLICFQSVSGAEEPHSSAGAKLPSARAVLDKYIEAFGGRDALLKHDSQHVKGKFELAAQGLKGDMEVWAAKPNRLSIKIELAGFGTIQSGFDGTIAWSVDPAMGPQILKGRQLEQLRHEADFLAALHEDKNFKSMEVLEQIQFENQECYKLKLVRQAGDEVIEFYNVKTGLMAGSIAPQETPLGSIKVTNVTGEYKKFDGLLLATVSTQKMMAINTTITMEAVDFAPVDAKVFLLPDSIKALQGKPEAPPKDAK